MRYVANKDVAAPPTIHDESCVYAQTRTKKPENGRWSPVFNTYTEAWSWASENQRTRSPRDCKVCNPLH